MANSIRSTHGCERVSTPWLIPWTVAWFFAGCVAWHLIGRVILRRLLRNPDALFTLAHLDEVLDEEVERGARSS